MYQIIEKEKIRQKQFVNLIPSENFTSQAVLDALGSPMQSMFDYLEAGHESRSIAQPKLTMTQ